MPLSFTDVDFRYRPRNWVLKDFGFDFPRGSTVLLGPNGAGKSTLLGLAASVLVPRRGHVRFNGLGYRSWRDRSMYRRRVTWMPQRIRAVPGFTAREQVAYVGWLKGMRTSAAWEGALEALDIVGLSPQAGERAGELSGGQLQRLGVAQAIVHSADLVLMDEPAAGLDPEQRGRFRDLVLRLRTRADLIVSTHQTEDILDSYDTVAVLSRGEILHTGEVADFLSHAPPDTPANRQAEAAYTRILADHGHGSE